MSINTKRLRESVSGTIVTARGKRFREMIFSIADHIDTIEAENKALTLAAEIEAERGDRLAAIADRLEGALKSMGHALGFEGANTGAPLDALAAEVAALRQPWQPIETAPKDGTRFIGAYSPYGKWIAEIVGGRSVETSSGKAFPATHWMPLPAPPVALSGESND